MARPALVAPKRGREDERRREPRRQPKEEADPVNQAVRRHVGSLGIDVARAEEDPRNGGNREEDDSRDRGLRTRQGPLEDDGKCTNAGCTRDKSDVHQPPEVA
jgi:hypothetical protein